MLRLLMATGALAAAFAVAPAYSAAPLPDWEGTFIVTAANAACGEAHPVGTFGTASYRPQQGGSTYRTVLLLFKPHAAAVHVSNTDGSQMHGEGQYYGERLDARDVSVSPPHSGNTRFTVNGGTPVVPTTGSVQIRGSITNFFGHYGCTVSLVANLMPRTD